MKARWGENVQHYSFFNLGAIWGGWSRHVPAALPPQERDSIPSVHEIMWAPGPARTGAENLAATGIRSPDRPA